MGPVTARQCTEGRVGVPAAHVRTLEEVGQVPRRQAGGRSVGARARGRPARRVAGRAPSHGRPDGRLRGRGRRHERPRRSAAGAPRRRRTPRRQPL